MNSTYKYYFSSLNTAKRAGKNAPHKAILLLAIMELIENGKITSENFTLSEDLEKAFSRIWNKYIGFSILFQPKVATPFWHMQNEPFYNLYIRNEQAKAINANPYSVKKLRENVIARIDAELFQQIQEETSRNELRDLLIKEYLQQFSNNPNNILPVITLLGMLLHMAA